MGYLGLDLKAGRSQAGIMCGEIVRRLEISEFLDMSLYYLSILLALTSLLNLNINMITRTPELSNSQI